MSLFLKRIRAGTLLGHDLLRTRLFSPDFSLSHFLYVMRHCDKRKSIFLLMPVVPSDRRLISMEADGAFLTLPPFVSATFYV